MMHEVKKYQLNILGESFTIVSDEPEQEITKAIGYVDSLMKEFSIKSCSADTKKIALLTAIKIACKMINIESEYEKLMDRENKIVSLIDKEL